MLERQRLRRAERLIDHPLHATRAAPAIVVAAGRLELGDGFISFGLGDRAILVGVEHLEHHVGALLRLRPRLVALREPAATPAILGEQLALETIAAPSDSVMTNFFMLIESFRIILIGALPLSA